MLSNFRILVFSFSICLLLDSCSNQGSVDSAAVKQEMASRELKRVSTSALMEKAMEVGNAIADESQKTLITALTNAINEGGTESAIEFCNLNAPSLISKYQDSLNISVMRVSEQYRNLNNKPDSLELLLLEAYAYEHETGNKLNASILEENQYVLLYTRPILLASTLCLQCHGKIGSDISESVAAKIDELYPADKAKEYEAGQLRGMWTIRIPKKTIVNLL